MNTLVRWGRRLRRAAGRADERGQGLAYVLIIGAVLLVFLTALVNVLVQEERWVVGSLRRSALVSTGDAAIDRAIYKMQVGGNWDYIGKGLLTGYHQDVVYTDVPNIRYTIQVLDGNWTPTVYGGVSSTGFLTGSEKTDRTITVFLSNTKTGERKKIQVVVIQSLISSAIFSSGVIGIGGNSEVHWGPVVSYSTATNSMNFGSLPAEPTFMSAGKILIGGATASSQGLNCDTPICLNCAGAGTGCVWENDPNLGSSPVMPLDELRSLAKGQNTDGCHYYLNTNCDNSPPNLPAIMDENTVVFWDTCDGTNYKMPGDSVCSKGACTSTAHGIDVAANGNFCGRGTFVVMGNLALHGTENCNVTMVPPIPCAGVYATSCSTITDQAFWDGFVYVGGSMSALGNKLIYGSIYAYDSAGLSGHMRIYYKSSNSTLGILGKTIFTKIWLERKPNQGDIFYVPASGATQYF